MNNIKSFVIWIHVHWRLSIKKRKLLMALKGWCLQCITPSNKTSAIPKIQVFHCNLKIHRCTMVGNDVLLEIQSSIVTEGVSCIVVNLTNHGDAT